MARKRLSTNTIGGKEIINKTNQAGQNFPTTNPNFIPREPQAQDIQFNPGTIGNRSVTRGAGTPEAKTTSLEQYREEKYNAENDLPTAIYEKVKADRRLQALADIQKAKEKPILEAQQKEAVGQVGQLTEEQQNKDIVQDNVFDQAKAGLSAVGGALGTGALIGAGQAGATGTTAIVAGALGGTALTAGATIAGGAILLGGGVYMFNERQDAKKAKEIYDNSISNMNKIIAGINQGTIPPEQYANAVASYNEQKANIYSAQRNLKEQTTNDLNKFLSGADNKAFEVNNYIDNVLPYQDQKLISAIMTPNPNNLVQEVQV